MKLTLRFTILLTAIFLFSCFNNQNIDKEIRKALLASEIHISPEPIITYKFTSQKLDPLYPSLVFYKSKIHTMYMEYPDLIIVTTYNKMSGQINIIPSMSYKQIDPDFLKQFVGKQFESNAQKVEFIQGFFNLYKGLEEECTLTFLDSPNSNELIFEIMNDVNMEEKFYLTFEDNILIDFNLDFKAITVH